MNKLRSFLFLSFAVVAVVTFQNCQKASHVKFESDKVFSYSSSSIQGKALEILAKNCYQCHNPNNQMGQVYDITNIDYLLYTRLLIPTEPEISPLLAKIVSGEMPPSKPLNKAEIDILKQWIEQLDPNAVAGGGGLTVTNSVEPKFKSIFDKILAPKCMACHQNRNYKFDNYTNTLRSITVNQADNSILYQAITTGRNGGKMPQGGALSSSEINSIKEWINSGAVNN
jgi:mono/diheme cytochrome c family protein